MLAVVQEKAATNRVTFSASDVSFGNTGELVLIPFQETMKQYGGKEIHAMSCTSQELVMNVKSQPLLAAIHIAFVDHLRLVLTPDVIWSTLLKGLSLHINQNSEQLRSRLVDFSGKQQIEVRRDDIKLGDPNLPWPEIIDEFANRIQAQAPQISNLLNARFSTTGLAERTAFQVALMNSMESMFSYGLSTLCGIPEILLEGDPDDWQEIRDRVERFRELDLDWWADALEPITAEFVTASKGKANSEFWDNIYKFHPPTGSGSPHTTGWVRDLFPYLKPDEFDHNNTYRLNTFMGRHSEEGPTIGEFPSAPSTAPFTWKYLNKTFNMEFIAGLTGVSCDENSLEVKPEFGWLVKKTESVLI